MSKRCDVCRKKAAADSARRFYESHPERGRISAARWRANNPEQSRRATREYMARQRVANRAAVNETKRRWRYGLAVGQYDRMLAEQDYRCAICRTHVDDLTKPLSVDHDHGCCDDKTTRKFCGQCVRGLLCGDCNWLLGLARDDVDRLRVAIGYVDSHRARVSVSA
jgi:hypothetical protein